MTYRALLLDFDGTLVNDRFEVHPRVEELLSELRKSGVCISLVTGKPYHGIVRDIVNRLNLTDPHVVSAGALIISPKNEEILFQKKIGTRNAKKAVDLLLQRKYIFSVEQDNIIYISNESITSGYGGKDIYKPVDTLMLKKPFKIYVASRHDKFQAEELYTDIEKIGGLEIIKFQTWKGFGCDITSRGVNKYSAVNEYRKLNKLQRSELVCVGDGLNDISMFNACGYKIALSHAPDELKKHADTVVDSLEGEVSTSLIKGLFKTG